MRCIVEDSEHPQKRLMLLSENISGERQQATA